LYPERVLTCMAQKYPHEHVKVAFIQLDANYEDAYIPSKAAAERLSYTSRTWKHTLNISEEDKALYELSTMYTLT